MLSPGRNHKGNSVLPLEKRSAITPQVAEAQQSCPGGSSEVQHSARAPPGSKVPHSQAPKGLIHVEPEAVFVSWLTFPWQL